MIDKPPASIALDFLGIPHRVFTHEKPVTSLEEAAFQRGEHSGQIVRSILFTIRPEEYLMVLVAGPDQIDWRKLRRYVKRSRMRMATEEEVLEVTGYRIGTVSPFGVRNQVRMLLDASVLKEEEVSLGSGVRNVAIIMKSADVLGALGEPEIIDLLESA